MFAWAWLRGDRLRLPLRDHAFLVLLGAFLFSTNYVLVYHATLGLTTGLVAVIFSTAVVWNMINGRLLLGRRLEPLVILGALFGLAGIVIVFWPELEAFESGGLVLTSVGFCLLGTFSFSLGNIVSQRNQDRRLPFIASTAYGMSYGALLLFAWALVRGLPFAFDSSPPYVWSLAYLTVLGTVVGFASYLLLVGRLGAARAAYATVLFPIVALWLSTLFEGYAWSLSGLLGVGLILCGNVVVLAAPHIRRRLLGRGATSLTTERP